VAKIESTPPVVFDFLTSCMRLGIRQVARKSMVQVSRAPDKLRRQYDPRIFLR